MEKGSLVKLLATPAIIALCLGCLPATAFAQSGAFTLTTVVRDGDPMSDGTTFNLCGFCNATMAGDHSLNDGGQTLISGLLSHKCAEGVYLASNRSGMPVADFCQQTPFGRFSAFSGGSINNRGQVALNMGPIVNNRIIDMILLYSNGQLTKIASIGDTSPDGIIFGGVCDFGQPSINNNGDVAFFACSDPDQQGRIFTGVYAYSNGTLRKVARGGDPSPIGGVIDPLPGNDEPIQINDSGEVLILAGQLDADPLAVERFGLFLTGPAGDVRNIELSGDLMPNGSRIAGNSGALGSVNNKGDVAYAVLLSGQPDTGIFLYSAGQPKTLMLAGNPTPIGGTFKSLLDPKDPENFPMPRVNDLGAVAFQLRVAGGSAPEAIFLASPKAMVKVVAIGDQLPTGEALGGISGFSLNNLGQVAFFAHSNDGILHPIGVYMATPLSPSLASVKTKGNPANLKLIVNGKGFITNDSTIEINGQAVETEYPVGFQQDGGTTTRLISRDPRLAQLLLPGQTVQVTVLNSLTARRGDPFPFSK